MKKVLIIALGVLGLTLAGCNRYERALATSALVGAGAGAATAALITPSYSYGPYPHHPGYGYGHGPYGGPWY